MVKGEPLRLADGDSLEGGIGRIEQVVAFSWDDDAWQREHHRPKGRLEWTGRKSGALLVARSTVSWQSAKRWCARPRMNSNSKAPSIPIDRPISWEDWQRGRRARRETSKQAAPVIVRRKTSAGDRRLRKLFKGRRSLPFAPTKEL
jgi:hypothetical protein